MKHNFKVGDKIWVVNDPDVTLDKHATYAQPAFNQCYPGHIQDIFEDREMVLIRHDNGPLVCWYIRQIMLAEKTITVPIVFKDKVSTNPIAIEKV
jgi:hypothetical protein